MRRIPQLDGLRGIAIGLVVLHHYIYQFRAPMPETLATIVYPLAGWGWSGVDLFFVLSGFLIGGILVDARESENYYATFYTRRAFRILPLYALLVAAGFLLVQLGEHAGARMSSISLNPAPWLYYLTFTQNFYFGNHVDKLSYLQITWSLAVEEQFYLTLPLLVRKLNRDRLLALSLGMVVFFGVLRSVLYWKGLINPMQSYILPFCRFDSLFIGVACAMMWRNERCVAWLKKSSRSLVVATAVLGTIFLFMDHSLWAKNIFLHTAGFTLIGLFYAAWMMLVLIRPDYRISRGLSCKPLMWLGKVSYCLYLIHGSALIIVDWLLRKALGPSELQMWLAILCGSALVLLLAHGSWAAFESRLIAFGHKFIYEGSNALEPQVNQRA